MQLTGTARHIRNTTFPTPAQCKKTDSNLTLCQEIQETITYFCTTEQNIVQALHNDTLSTTSNGSFLYTLQLGSAAWILTLDIDMPLADTSHQALDPHNVLIAMSFLIY